MQRTIGTIGGMALALGLSSVASAQTAGQTMQQQAGQKAQQAGQAAGQQAEKAGQAAGQKGEQAGSLVGKKFGVSSLATATATVAKIDKADRKLWLRDAQGKDIEGKVGDAARNFDQINEGDRVSGCYCQSIVASIRKPGEAPQGMTEKKNIERAPVGGRPGGMVSKQTSMTAQVVSVDTAKNVIVLRTPEGKKEDFKVSDPDLQKKLS